MVFADVGNLIPPSAKTNIIIRTDGADPPVDYDGVLQDNDRFELLNEEISISTVSVWGTALGTASAPANVIGCVGW